MFRSLTLATALALALPPTAFAQDTGAPATDPTVAPADQAPTDEAPTDQAPDAAWPSAAGGSPQADSVYVAGDTVTVADVVLDDLFAAGSNVTLTVDVGDNAFLAGEVVTVPDGVTIRGDLFAAGGTVFVSGRVDGDVYAAGGEVQVTSTGSIGGGVMLGAGKAQLLGPVAGDVSVGTGELLLDTTVGGDVEAEVGQLRIGPGAVIEGDLWYKAPEPADQDPAATVMGGATFVEDVQADADIGGDDSDLGWGGGGWSLGWKAAWASWAYLGGLLVGLPLLWLGGAVASRPAEVVRGKLGSSLGVGLAAFVLPPVLALAAIALILPLQAGLLLFGVWGIALALSGLVTAQAVGHWGLERFGQAAPSPYLALAAGLLPLVLLQALPVVSGLVWLAAAFAGLGGLVLAVRGGGEGLPAK